MKRIFGILLALVLVASLGLLTAGPDQTGGPAYAAGAQPMALAGIASTITPAGPVPAGTLVQAYVGTELRAETTTEAEGLYMNLLVPGPGGTVTFRVAGVLAQESITWESGEIMDDFDLTIPALPSAGYTLTMASSPIMGGTATDVTGASPYLEGEVVSIQAAAASGYQFVGWTAPAGSFANSNAASTTFTMSAQDVTVTAHFEVIPPIQYSLTISSNAGGSVTTPGEGTFTYDAGTVVSLVATPTTGYGFVNWAGDVHTIANANLNAATTTITMEGDYEITARFMGVGPATTQTVIGSDTVYARDEADTEVKVTGTGTAMVTVAPYIGNPGGDPPTDFITMRKYIDVNVSDTTDVTEVEIRLYYTDDELTAADIDEESLRLSWLDGEVWKLCSHSGVNTDSNYIWAKIRATDTTPTLAYLQGQGYDAVGYKSSPPPPQPICFIATSAYGTDTAKEIDILREFRDAVLLPNSLGTEFVSLYYKISPPIANFISQHEVLRTAVRLGFVDPIVKILNWSHALWSTRGS